MTEMTEAFELVEMFLNMLAELVSNVFGMDLWSFFEALAGIL